jgi:hypothetical protein
MNVLSTTSSNELRLQTSAILAMSQIFNVGFVGDSIQTILDCGVMARSSSPSMVRSTKENVMPYVYT